MVGYSPCHHCFSGYEQTLVRREREREREIPSNIQQKKCSMVSAEKKGRRIHEEKKTRNACFIGFVSIPRCSMYGRFTYIWLKLMVNVGRYTIHGAYIYIHVYIYILNNTPSHAAHLKLGLLFWFCRSSAFPHLAGHVCTPSRVAKG